MSSRLELRDYPMLLLAAEILRGGGTVHVKAWGNSMLPTLWPGDLLTIQRAAFEELLAGDIVLVLRNGRFFIHRFVEKQEVQDRLSVVTRGDAMPDSDPPASASQLLGRVAVVRRAERIFVPARRVSPFHSALAWALCHSDRIRTLTLRMHEARRRLAGEFSRSHSARSARFRVMFHPIAFINDDTHSRD